MLSCGTHRGAQVGAITMIMMVYGSLPLSKERVMTIKQSGPLPITL